MDKSEFECHSKWEGHLRADKGKRAPEGGALRWGLGPTGQTPVFSRSGR